MNKQIYYGTSPVPPPGYEAVALPADEEVPTEAKPEITEEEQIQKKRNAISAGISAAKKSGRTRATHYQRIQIPKPLVKRR